MTPDTPTPAPSVTPLPDTPTPAPSVTPLPNTPTPAPLITDNAKAVIDRINELHLQTITLEKKSLVQSVRTAYETLTEDEKKEVSNYNLLVEMEPAFRLWKQRRKRKKKIKPARKTIFPIIKAPQLQVLPAHLYIMHPISMLVRISIWTA